ncbi:MAG TPA: response regulator, partial [Nannocystaceae bacterium]|nr:response regulator [Nannocystaceae bacterium]
TPLPDLTPASRRLTLLLADDDPVNRLILGELLRDLGHFVVEAIDGADAIARLDAHAIDLVLLDMHMPGLDGPATVRAIRGQSGRLASVPILGLTADVTAARIEEFRRSGVDDVLTKPIDVATLQRALDRVTGESAARPAAAAPGA